jgi:protein involved in polysaccharide export with SLBB domain
MLMNMKILISNFLFVTIIILSGFSESFSQELDKKISSFPYEDLIKKTQLQKAAAAAIPLEGTIDPDQYILGPGDEMTIGIWGAISVSYPLTVTPEGTLIIPTVGEVKVSQKSLTEAKKQIRDRTKSKYLNTDVSVTLTAPRTFLVHVTGVVGNQGTYQVSSVDRVDKAILLASQTSFSPSNTLLINTTENEGRAVDLDLRGQLEKADPNKVEEIYKRISTRKIIVYRKDGSIINVDIPYYYATGLDKFNPYLQDGDRVAVPSKNITIDFTSIYGEVNKPDIFEFVAGDNLGKLLTICGGLTPLADSSSIYLLRFNPEAKYSQPIKLSVHKDLNFELERGDQIVVNSIKDRPANLFVYLTGELNHIGFFPIKRNQSKLSEVIKTIGGFTSNADLRNSLLVRIGDEQRFIDKEFQSLMNLRSADVKYLDSVYLFKEIELGKRTVNVDFVKLFMQKDSSYDIILEHGDVIYIPPINNNVYVFGQVKNPGYLPFDKHQSYDDYISSAGGFSVNADQGKIKIIKARTYQWLDPDETDIQPGDAIWVPREPERQFLYYFSIARDGLGIIASIATIYLLLQQIGK